MDTREVDRRTGVQSPNRPAQRRRAGRTGGRTRERRRSAKGRRPEARHSSSPAASSFSILALVFGHPWLLYALSHQGTDDARVDADVVAVTSKINERIDQILVDTNQPVHKGQLLIVLDNKDELARLQQAQAQYDLARRQSTHEYAAESGRRDAGDRQRRQRTKRRFRSRRPASRKPTAQLRVGAGAAAGSAGRRSRRRRPTTRAPRRSSEPATCRAQQLDAARAEQAQAAAQLRGAQDQINAAQADVDAAQARVGASQRRRRRGARRRDDGARQARAVSDPSQVESAKAQLDLAKQNLGYTRIYSAIDGYVGEKNAEVGQTVSAGTTLMTLIPHKQSTSRPTIKKRRWATCKSASPSTFASTRIKASTFHGHVDVDQPGVAEHLRAGAGAECDRQLREGDAAHSRAHLDRRPARGHAVASGHERRNLRESQVGRGASQMMQKRGRRARPAQGHRERRGDRGDPARDRRHHDRQRLAAEHSRKLRRRRSIKVRGS